MISHWYCSLVLRTTHFISIRRYELFFFSDVNPEACPKPQPVLAADPWITRWNSSSGPSSSLEWCCSSLYLEPNTSLTNYTPIPHSKPNLVTMARSRRKVLPDDLPERVFKKERDCATLWLGFSVAPVWSFLSLTLESCHVSNKESTHWNRLWNLQLTLKQKKPNAVGLGWVQHESCTVSSTWLNTDRMKGFTGCLVQWNSSTQRQGLGQRRGGGSYASSTEDTQSHRAETALSASGRLQLGLAGSSQLWVTHLIAACILQTGPASASCWSFTYHWTAPFASTLKRQQPITETKGIVTGGLQLCCPLGRLTISKQYPARKCSYKRVFARAHADLWELLSKRGTKAVGLSPSQAQALEGLKFRLCGTSKITMKGEKGFRREALNIPGAMLLRECHTPWEWLQFGCFMSVCL